MNRFLLPALLVMLPFWVHAQFTLSGRVTASTDSQPLPGASIRIDGTHFQTLSHSNGDFSFQNLKAGNYVLITSYIGFAEDTNRIELKKNATTEIVLQPVSFMQEGVVVTSTRAGNRTPVASENLSRKDISSLNYGQDLPVLLSNSISSLSTSDAGNGMGYTALRIRGTDMTRINVTINGIPLNDPESHNVYWVDLPDFATSTDNIQIQRGVGTSTNGASAFGASINLQSSHLRTDPYAGISSSYGTFNTMKNSISFGTGLLHKHFSLDGRVSKLHSDGYIDRAFSNLLSGYLSGAWTTQRDLLRINIFSGKERTYQAWGGVPSELLDSQRTYNPMGEYTDRKGNVLYYDNQTDNYVQTHYQALYSHNFGNEMYLNFAAHRTEGAGYYEEYCQDAYLPDYGINPIVTNSPYYIAGTDTIATPDGMITNADLVRQKHLANTFNGITWSLNKTSARLRSSLGGSWNQYDGNHFGRVIWWQASAAGGINPEWYRSKAVKKDMNVYGKTEFALTPELTAWTDVQLRHIRYSIEGTDNKMRDITQEHTFTFFNPKAGVSFRFSEKQSAYASFAVSGREPNRDNFVDADPAKPSPQRERLYDAEAGYSFTSDRIGVSANLYFMDYDQQLVLTGAINDVGSPVMVNVPESYRAGIELSAKTVLTTSLSWEPSVTLSRNRIKAFTEYIDDWDTWGQTAVEHTNTDLAFSPAVIAGSTLSWTPLKAFDISLISRYAGKQYTDNTSSDDRVLNAYFVNNLMIRYILHPAFLKEVSFSVLVNNLFDTEYESNAWVYRYSEGGELKKMDGYFPQAGIHFMAGLNVQF
jgi:iron complex outermembrane recepter protein